MAESAECSQFNFPSRPALPGDCSDRRVMGLLGKGNNVLVICANYRYKITALEMSN